MTRIRLNDGTYREVHGRRFGAWLAHRMTAADCGLFQLNDDIDHWRVSHARSGASLAPLVDDLSERDATHLAVFLAARVGDFEFVIDTEHDVAKFVDGDTAHVVMAVVAEFVAEVM